MLNLFVVILLSFGPSSFAAGCVDFSGVYLSGDEKAVERCFEIKQQSCRKLSYTWHFKDGAEQMHVQTDGVFREYHQQPGVFKSFLHLTDGGFSFAFYHADEPEVVSDSVKTKISHGILAETFYPDRTEPSRAIRSLNYPMDSVAACLAEIGET